MTELGEGLPVYRPPLNMGALFGEPDDRRRWASSGVTVRYLTPHNKWSIHSEYQDNLFMLSLSRGGQTIWMSDQDAAKVGVEDNDWIEAVNRNGVVVARAIVSHRMPEGTVYMHHAQDRLIDVPIAETSGKRGGIHNSLTRILVKPSHLIGGYAQLSFAFNYLGPTGNQRDEVTVIRKRIAGGDVLMKVMAQMAMVMNLDKCIGCHTCSVTCKQAWTNRTGTEYVWFNNVETRPGQGYPRRYEDQEEWKGGWTLNKRGRLALKGGGRLRKLLTIFSNPKMPSIQDYYEPWTYDYATLTDAPAQEHTPVARPKSLLTGKDMKITWSSNWDDNLGGSAATAGARPDAEEDRGQGEVRVRADLHVLPAADLRALPQPVVRRVLPQRRDLQARPRTASSWSTRTGAAAGGCASRAAPTRRSTSTTAPARPRSARSASRASRSGCPPSAPRPASAGCATSAWCCTTPTRCSAAASTPDEHGLYEAQREVFLDPHDPEVQREAERAGIPRDWVEAAQRSPIHALINRFKVALPLHPEYRTMPMVWYIPPLSPVVDVVKDTGYDAEDKGNLFAAIDALRIPVEYLAELFTAGDVAPVDRVLKKLAAMRSYMRDINMGREPDASIPAAVGMTEEEMYDMYRLLAIAKYDERYVIPPAHAEQAHSLEELATECSVSEYGGGQPGDLRRGVRWPDADRGRELPDAPGPADRRHAGRAGRQGVAGQPAQLGRQGPPERAVPAAARRRGRQR